MSDAKEMTPEQLAETRAFLFGELDVDQPTSVTGDVHEALFAHIDALTARLEAAERERDALKSAECQAGTVLAEAGDVYDPRCPFCGVDCGADEEAEPVHFEDCPMAPQHEDVGDWMRAIVDLHGQQQRIADIAREALDLPRDASPKDVSDALDRLAGRDLSGEVLARTDLALNGPNPETHWRSLHDIDVQVGALKARADAAEKKLAALADAADTLASRWPEGACLVAPPCGACVWCRFEAAIRAARGEP